VPGLRRARGGDRSTRRPGSVPGARPSALRSPQNLGPRHDYGTVTICSGAQRKPPAPPLSPGPTGGVCRGQGRYSVVYVTSCAGPYWTLYSRRTPSPLHRNDLGHGCHQARLRYPARHPRRSGLRWQAGPVPFAPSCLQPISRPVEQPSVAAYAGTEHRPSRAASTRRGQRPVALRQFVPGAGRHNPRLER